MSSTYMPGYKKVFDIIILFLMITTRPKSAMLQKLAAYYAFWKFPNFLPIMLVFMFSRYGLC